MAGLNLKLLTGAIAVLVFIIGAAASANTKPPDKKPAPATVPETDGNEPNARKDYVAKEPNKQPEVPPDPKSRRTDPDRNPSQFQNMELSFETITCPIYSAHDKKKNCVIKELPEWQKLRGEPKSRARPKKPCPDINFKEDMVIAVFQGQRPTAGYSVRITRIIERKDSLEVLFRKKSLLPMLWLLR